MGRLSEQLAFTANNREDVGMSTATLAQAEFILEYLRRVHLLATVCEEVELAEQIAKATDSAQKIVRSLDKEEEDSS